MRGVVIFLGILLLLGGGAVAGAQFAPPSVDLSFLASLPGAQDFLKTQTALFAGGGAAGLGLLLMIVGMATGGGKKRAARAPREERAPVKEPKRAEAPEPKAKAKAQPAPPAAPKPQTKPQPAPQPVQAAAAPRPAPQPPAKPELRAVPTPSAKPQASASPPSSKQASPPEETAPTWTQDPRLMNRKRVSDLVSINDALKAHHASKGAYPKAEGLRGFAERGKTWIPGLSPDFIAELPRDPAQGNGPGGPQYLYASNGKDYKLLADGVSLAGGTNVEVLGVRIDPSKQNTMEKAAFGFWTEAFATV